jgi:uncharacterized protein YdiU (UPF0061 family)
MSNSQESSVGAEWCLEHSYSELPTLFHQKAMPVAVKDPRLVVFNHRFAERLGLAIDPPVMVFAGNELPAGARPIAQAYAGHQFGHFTTLGDGRAILLGEQLAPDGRRWDIQLKGAGRTAFSRGGDGRAALGPMLREYIISEAMHGLGIPTTRSLAVVATGEDVRRQDILPGAVLTRVASSHIRVGTFEWAAANRDQSALRALADYTIRRHFPALATLENPYQFLLGAVVGRQAALVAQWQCVGFIHGVMNTDNMAISGETIDYGPCAFMDGYDPATVFSSIDHRGRYAYGNQPRIAQWNLARLAEALLPLLHEDEEKAIEVGTLQIESFGDLFEREWLGRMRAKLGLFAEEAGDRALIEALLEWMRESRADFTHTFRELSRSETARILLESQQDWQQQWHARLGRQEQSLAEAEALMLASNPACIPRNYRVEEALAAASDMGDLSVMEELLEVLGNPYDVRWDDSEYRLPPAPGAGVYQTFCGT